MTVELRVNEEASIMHLRVSGKLRHADYEEFVPEVDRFIAEHRKAMILFEMHDFEGWTAGALWDDLLFGVKHINGVKRIAIVAEKSWEHGLASFLKPFTRARMRHFPSSELEDAKAWLAEEVTAWDKAGLSPEVSELMERMDGEAGLDRQDARRELVKMGPSVLESLIQAAERGRWQLRLEATRAIAAIADPSTADALAHKFEDSFEIGWAASQGIAKMGRVGAEAALKILIEEPRSHGVRSSTEHALRIMEDSEVRAKCHEVADALGHAGGSYDAPVVALDALKKLQS